MSALRQRMIQDMQLHGYSEATQKAYLRTVRQLSEYFRLSPGQITEDQLREYFLHRKSVNKWARTTMRIAYSGIKFFFQNTLKRDWDTLTLVRAEAERMHFLAFPGGISWWHFLVAFPVACPVAFPVA